MEARRQLDVSRAYDYPEDYLYAHDKKNNDKIYEFIQKRKNRFKFLIDNYSAQIGMLELSVPQILSIGLKATLNKEYEPIRDSLELLEKQLNEKETKRQKVQEEKEHLQKKAEESIKSFFSQAKNFFTRLFSFVQQQYFQWRLNKNQSELDILKESMGNLVWEVNALKMKPEFQAFGQRYADGTHEKYVTDPELAEKVKALAQAVDPLFEYALSPEKRSLKKSLFEKKGMREHRKPILKQPLTFPAMTRVMVPQQNGEVDCALRALLNVKRLGQQFDITEIKADDDYAEALKAIKERSPERNWLDDANVFKIIENNEEYKNIIFIPSIYRFKEMRSMLYPNTLQQLSNFQKDYKAGRDVTVEIVSGDMRQNGDCQNGGHHDNGHYMAIVIQQENGNTKVKYANSLRSYSCDHIVQDLLKILTTYDFENVVVEEDSNTVVDALNRLDFRNVFLGREYFNPKDNPKQKIQTPLPIIAKDLEELVDWILEGAETLYAQTQGKATWTHSGFKDMKAEILDTLDAIESCDKQPIEIFPHNFKKIILLSPLQQACINQLREKLK